MSPSEIHFKTPYGEFELRRYPRRDPEPLRAWNSADELLLEEAWNQGVDPGRTLVANDEHGALTVAIQPVAGWTDSALSAQALSENAAANGRSAAPLVWSVDTPPADIDQVLLRIPRQLAYLEYQLARLAAQLRPGAIVLAGGMDKHLSAHTAGLLERYIGPTQRHRGRKKARLFSATRDQRAPPSIPPPARYACPGLAQPLQSLPNVFSRERLDIGSRLLLDALGDLEPACLAIDLACGNGVLGLSLFARNLCRQLLFIDESAMAIASARFNARALFPDADAARLEFHQADGLCDYTGTPADLILCNPPFHMQHAVEDFVGRRLLHQGASHLAPQGRLLLVANRHLDYARSLDRVLGRPQVLRRTNKFNLLLMQRA